MKVILYVVRDGYLMNPTKAERHSTQPLFEFPARTLALGGGSAVVHQYRTVSVLISSEFWPERCGVGIYSAAAAATRTRIARTFSG